MPIGSVQFGMPSAPAHGQRKRFHKHEVDVRVHVVELQKAIDDREGDGWVMVGHSIESSEWTLLWGK